MIVKQIQTKRKRGSSRFRPHKQGPASLSQIEDYFWEWSDRTSAVLQGRAEVLSGTILSQQSHQITGCSTFSPRLTSLKTLNEITAWIHWNDSNKAEGRLNRPSEVQTVSQATAAGRFLRQLISAVHGITASSPGAKRVHAFNANRSKSNDGDLTMDVVGFRPTAAAREPLVRC